MGQVEKIKEAVERRVDQKLVWKCSRCPEMNYNQWVSCSRCGNFRQKQEPEQVMPASAGGKRIANKEAEADNKETEK